MSKSRKRRPKWGTVGRSGKRTLDGVAMSFVKYMELTTAARKYLKANKRIHPKLDFKLYTEAEFCQNALLYLFGVTKSFIVNAQQRIRVNPKEFEKEVEQFCKGIVQDSSVLVTKNLEKEMGQIMQRNKVLESKGKIII